MAFVPGYEHDIFVSYAHVDDQPFSGVDEGWVTTLIRGLKNRLGKKLGRSDAYSLWMDYELSHHKPITPEILDTLQKTATVVIILSPGYVASEWCVREKDTFLRVIQERARSGSRAFIVERDKLEESVRPPEFGELLGYRFWIEDREGRPPRTLGEPKPDLDERRYYDLLNDLSYDLEKELRRLKADAENFPSPSPHAAETFPPPNPRATVFLAEVTDDLDPERDEVKRYLDQQGLRVLPEVGYSRDTAAFQQAVDKDLAECTLFVQLLSGVLGKRPPDLPQGYSRLQYERALAAKKPILQWRPPDLDTKAIRDERHRAFVEGVEGNDVQAVNLEEFKHEALQRALPKPPQEKLEGSRGSLDADAWVFVNAEASDFSLAEAVGAALVKHQVGYVLPLQNGKPEKIRKDLEYNLQYCDALIFVYGHVTPAWIREQWGYYYRKIRSKRKSPLRALAVYEGPPDPKDSLGFSFPNLRILNGRTGPRETVIQDFLSALQAGR